MWESGILNLRGCWIRRWSESGLNETPRGPVGTGFPAPHQQKGLLQVDILLAMIQGLWGGGELILEPDSPSLAAQALSAFLNPDKKLPESLGAPV